MPLERNSLAIVLAILALAALSMLSAKSWADGGGAGIQFQIEYDDKAGSDVDEGPDSATTQPSGFGFTTSVKYDLSKWLEVNASFFGVTELNEAESSPGITLDGPRFSDDTVTYFTPRFNGHFPAVSYTPAEPGASVDLGEPIEASESFEITPRLQNWTWLWAGETAVEEAA